MSDEIKLPKVKRGERLYVRVETEGREDLEDPGRTGPDQEVGGSYLFLFPFDVFVEADVTTQTSYVDQTENRTEVRIYPPFLNDPGDALLIPQTETGAIPYDPPGIAPDFDKVRLKEFNRSPWFAERRNGLRIDLFPDRGPDFAARIIEDYLGLVRWWTRQWWVGRDRRHQEDYLRNYFPVNELGERLEGVSSYYGEYGGFGFERPLSLEFAQNVRGNLTNGRTIPLSWDVFFDAIYFHASKHRPRAVLTCAIACEARISEEVDRLGDRENWSKAKKKAIRTPNDIVQQIVNLGNEVGVQFSETEPDHWDWIKALRTGRGNVAHGNQALFPKDGVTKEASDEDVFAMLVATMALSDWMGAR